MIIADALNLHIYPVITDMTDTKQIPILRVCSTEKIVSKEFLVEETLSQVCFKNEDESEGIIVDESSM